MNKENLTQKYRMSQIIIDIVLLCIIMATGWFLIGYYLQGEYLAASYQDWIYHAWRVQSIDRYGMMPSWDHIWSNGLNHWRSYQYMQHILVLILSKAFHISITKTMLFLTVAIFIGVRVMIYGVLRSFHVRPIFAFLATMVSFTYVQQWIAISDFSIFVAFLIVPFYVYVWIHVLNKYQLKDFTSIKDRRFAEYVFAAISGALWIVHPVVANALGGLFFMSIGFRAVKIQWKYFVGLLVSYIVGTLPFFLPYLVMDYRFSNPVFTTAGFVRETIAGDFFGLSMYFIAAMMVIFIMTIFMPKKVPTWSKIIISYTSIYFLIIYLAQNEYIPAFITQLQISRVVPILAILIVFAFGGALHGVMGHTKKISRGVVIVILIISTIAISESIKIATAFTSQPVRTLNDPVSLYFNDKETPRGSIYVKNVAAASFFGKENLRFISSYNEHLLPHPLSVRFSYFMRSEIAYTGVTKTQIQLIKDYITVLGVEYLVLPEASPLIKSLTQSNQEDVKPPFEVFENVSTRDGTFSILHNAEKITNAYLVNANNPLLQWNEEIPKPTMKVNSYQKWDAAVSSLAQKIRSQEVQSATLEFIDTDKLFVALKKTDFVNKKVLITQSYDLYWSINKDTSIINPSQTRFITVDLDNLSYDGTVVRDGVEGILLQNSWPVWHWVLQTYGATLVFLLFAITLIRPRKFIEQLH